MGWNKLKCILAAMLAAVNLFLLYMVREQARALDYIPEQAVEKLITLLKEDQIFLTEDALDTAKESSVIYGGETDEGYYTRVAEALSESTENLSFTTPDGVILTVRNGDRFAFVSGFGIRYEAAGFSSLLTDSAFFETSVSAFSENGRLLLLDLKESRSVSESVRRFLQGALGTTSSPDTLDYDTVCCFTDPKTKVQYAVCVQKIKERQVANLKAAFAVLDGTVIGMNGQWCFDTITDTYSAQLYDQLHILYSVKERIAAENSESVTVVESVSLAYAVYYHADSDRFYLIPTWRVTIDDGREFLFNSVDGRYKQSDV